MKTIDCLLISPPISYDDDGNIWKQINSNFPPLGLASMASVARNAGYTVRIVDCTIAAPAVSLFETFCQKNLLPTYERIRYIGITSFTFNIKKALALACLCKQYYPQATILLGGCHATALPYEVIAHPAVDMVVVGEGEYTLLDLLADKDPATINGVVYKNTLGAVERTPARERIPNLDLLPMPAYDLLPIEHYRPAKGSYKRLPAMSMMTSRGCPGECTFCFKTLGKRLVFKSAQKIIDEIEFLIDRYGIKQILFYDDTFTVYKKNVLALCDRISEKKLDISWTCFARVDYVDKPMLHHMAAAGCHQIMYGIENVNETVLHNIKKKINREQMFNAVRWTKQAGIECRVALMVGNPGDTKEIVEENLSFIKKVSPDYLIVNIATPLPGTEMFAWADEHRLILSYDWDNYTLAKPLMRLENLSAEEIKILYKYLYYGFYLRPAYIFGRFVRIRSWYDIQRLWDGFCALFSFLFS